MNTPDQLLELNAEADYLGVTPLELTAARSLLAAARTRPGGIIRPEETARFNMTVGDVRDIEAKLRGTAALDAAKAKFREAAASARRRVRNAGNTQPAASPLSRAAVAAMPVRRIVEDVRVAPAAAIPTSPIKIVWQQEVDTIAHLHGFAGGYKQLSEKSRKSNFVAARSDVFAHLLERGWSLPRVGDLFGMDHTSVMHARNRRAAFASAVGSMNQLFGEARLPAEADALPKASLTMLRYRKHLPTFEALAKRVRSAPSPRTYDDCFVTQGERPVLSDSGLKFVTEWIGAALRDSPKPQ